MSKLKNIIKQLSESDYLTIYSNLMDNNAEKSASLLKYMKERQLSDNKIMVELDVNPNAYYTLRSRLNEKIEEFLVKEMESPKADILKKVANINEIVFTKKRTIVIATLKKLEKELIDYDLSNELIIVYKNLKKLNTNTSEHYYYSQLYNKHIAYTLALDKAEYLLADYFKKFGDFFFNQDDLTKTELILLKKEILNISRLYQSHRLYVYQSCLCVFHQLYIEPSQKLTDEDEHIEDIFEKIDKIFDNYSADASYHHLRIVFDFLKQQYCVVTGNLKKGDKFYDAVNESLSVFLSNYGLYTFPSLFLLSKLQKNMEAENPEEVLEENKVIFADFECETIDAPKYILYHTYRALNFFYAQKYEQSSKVINGILNETSLKKYPLLHIEIKTLLALQYCLLKDDDLFNQLMNSIQRQIRMIGKVNIEHIVLFTKAMKISINGTNKGKLAKLKALLEKTKLAAKNLPFSPLKHIPMDVFMATKMAGN